MQMRHITRLTNTSREKENLQPAYALHFAYNFCRVHSTLEATPGMTAGITTTVGVRGINKAGI